MSTIIDWRKALSREELALRILCASIHNSGFPVQFTENSVRAAFDLAMTFERVSDEVGGRPSPFSMRGRAQYDVDDDDD